LNFATNQKRNITNAELGVNWFGSLEQFWVQQNAETWPEFTRKSFPKNTKVEGSGRKTKKIEFRLFLSRKCDLKGQKREFLWI
jgi:hypothetical protein